MLCRLFCITCSVYVYIFPLLPECSIMIVACSRLFLGLEFCHKLCFFSLCASMYQKSHIFFIHCAKDVNPIEINWFVFGSHAT